MPQTTTVKELLQLDAQLRNSEKPPLYDLLEENPYKDVQFNKNHFTMVEKNIRVISDEIDWVQKYDVFDRLFAQIIKPLPKWMQKHIAIAGGSILRTIRNGKIEKNDMHPSTPSIIPDIDVFLYNITDTSVATRIVKALCTNLSSRISQTYEVTEEGKTPPAIFRNQNSITFENLELNVEPMRCTKVQIILRLYENLAQIAYGFDLQCASLCLVAKEGSEGEEGDHKFKVVGSELAMFTLATDHILIDSGRRSATFPTRIHKYAELGFRIIFPFMDVEKVAKTFAHSDFVDPESWSYSTIARRDYFNSGQKGCRIEFSDCYLYLYQREDTALYYGHINRKYTSNITSTGDYGDITSSKIYFLHTDEYNLSLLKTAIASEDNKQPNLFIPITCKTITSNIDGKTVYRKIIRNMKQNDDRRNTLLLDKKEWKFDNVFKLQYRKVDPGSQWTTSFNPINESAESWYQDYYTNNEIQPDQIVTYQFSPSLLKTDNLSLRATILSSEPNTVAQKLIEGDFTELSYSIHKQSSISLLSDIITLNSLRDTGSLSEVDMRAIAEFFSPILDSNLSEAINIFEHSYTTKRNSGLFKDLAKREAFLQNTLPFAKVIHEANQRRLKRTVKSGSSQKKYIWQEICANLKDYPTNELVQEAKKFGITLRPTESDTESVYKRKLCIELAKMTEEMMVKLNSVCVNADEDTLGLDGKIADLPKELQWTREYQGKKYCYSLREMYESIIHNVERDPRGLPFTKEMKKDIIQRTRFLNKVMTPYGKSLLRLSERASESYQTQKREDYENSEVGMITRLIDLIPYCPLDVYTMNILTIEEVKDIAYKTLVIIGSGNDRAIIATLEDKKDILNLLLRIVRSNETNKYAVRAAMDDFIGESEERIETIRDQQRREQRSRSPPPEINI